MQGYIDMMSSLADFEEVLRYAENKQTPINIAGVSDSVRAHLIFCLANSLNRPALVVTHSPRTAMRLSEDLGFFMGSGVPKIFPESELLFYDVVAKGHDVMRGRLGAIETLCTEENAVVITTANALLSATLPSEAYRDNVITLRVGDEIELDDLASRLSALGYRRENMVEGAGQFSIRGGIVDYFPYGSSEAYRIEFFDREVDSVRLFDTESQRTVDRAGEARITPAAEIILSDSEREKLILKLSGLADKAKEPENLRRDIEKLKSGIDFPSIDKYIPYIYDKKPTIIDYLPENALVFWDDPLRISESCEGASAALARQTTELFEHGVIPAADAEYSRPLRDALKDLMFRPFFGLSALETKSADYAAKHMVSFTSKSLADFRGRMDLLTEALDFYVKNNYRIVITGGAETKARNLAKKLSGDGYTCSYSKELGAMPERGTVCVVGGSISHGFEYPLINAAVIGDREIFGSARKPKRIVHPKNSEKINNFTDLKPGDYVVHRSHGIGRYIGIEQLVVDSVRKDYLKICYKNDDFLYVPTDQLDMVYKYTGKEGARVRVNKLGGSEWSRTKQRVRAAAQDMAKELIDLYAARTNIQGIEFGKDGEWQKEFEELFPYEETDDQLRSIDEVKADMEKPYPMDRLLCGDVGYGKTEVAIRAAFKAVMDGYQVAYLVPTTILASQHFGTFKQRMKGYPINIAMLSRFCSQREEKEIKKQLQTGETDIVIGTHKLLSGSVKFKKLGLLIIDEEQRFGVTHKEKIKTMSKNVDVLTLSATPIPRTLHMSLSGIRDMSVINQPPGERHPIVTYVLEYDENAVREAVQKEIDRGGQVYYLFNRVNGIYSAANRIAELVPQARVAVAHGRMSETELEQIMMDVSSGEIDVLICTTIIETGLDIPNVNTIIIEDADRLGLAQLYQLRGRVGRSNRLAYAYLTFRRNKVLTEEAEKRLLAIKEFTEFGSGFKIAMRDLEIRGAGNLVGAEQHGHMEAVGYEMYCRLLEEAVRSLKGEEAEAETETVVDLPVSAYLPETYVSENSQRIAMYKRIASISTQEELYDVYDETEDRYGTVPSAAQNLMEVALIRALASRLHLTEIKANDDFITIKFDEQNPPDMQRFVDLVNDNPQMFSLISPQKPVFKMKLRRPKDSVGCADYLKAVKDLLS